MAYVPSRIAYSLGIRPLWGVEMKTSAIAHLLLICSILPGQALAHATIAIGEPADVSKAGLAVGASHDWPTRAGADAEALKLCRAYQDAPQPTRDLCKVVGRFDNRCLSVALDPRPSTYGYGWAVLDTKVEADHVAMTNCRATAREEAGACVTSLSKCDTTPPVAQN